MTESPTTNDTATRRHLSRRPRAGGLVVPYIVDEKRAPIDFKRLDVEHVKRCATGRRCAICGDKIAGELAFIGPEKRLDDACFADAWMHLGCAKVAMRQCPFLVGRRDWRDEAAREDAELARYSHSMRLYTSADGEAHLDKLRNNWHFRAKGELTEVVS